MLGNITIGQYFPGDSLLHRMDPRTKILATLIYIVAIFFAQTVVSYLFVTAFTVWVIWLSKLPVRLLWNALKPLWIIIARLFFYRILIELKLKIYEIVL